MRRIRLIVVVASVSAVALAVALSPVEAQEPPPQTGFEQSDGASWTTHEEELAFLAEVDERSDRVEMEVIGTTLQGRPLHLVQVGHPTPHGLEAALNEPTTLFVCSQHGNEPSGREGCLMALRDLAFTDDPALVDLLSRQTFLFVPAANPDGRAQNSRGNSQGVDINRDHLNLRTNEARAIGAVVRDWQPDLSMDLHEYGPSVPALYDDMVLYLWPRNLNVEKGVHDLARSFALDKIEPCSEEAGYTADEYGQYAAGDVNLVQTAGDGDEGIMRNAMGLRHSLGILIETAVTQDPRNTDDPEITTAANQRRRVNAARHIIDCSLEWMDENGETAASVTSTAPLRKEGEGLAQNVPVYFGGGDNEDPADSDVLYPPPCAYVLTPAQAAEVGEASALHGIRGVAQEDGTLRIPMGQAAEPLIPLLLDGRGNRSSVSGEPMLAPPFDARCGVPEEGGTTAAATAAPLALLAGAMAMEARRRRRA